jgi:hypothetical protein
VINALHKIDKILPTTPVSTLKTFILVFYDSKYIFAKMAVGGGTAVGVHGTGKNYGALCDYIEGNISYLTV